MTTALTGFLTFLLGLLLGNWLAIGRDKRKEFNDAAAPVRGWLLGAKDAPSPYDRRPSAQEIDLFIHYLRPWHRSRFMRLLDSHNALHQSMRVQDAAGQVSYSDDADIRHVLTQLLRYTRPR